LPTLNKYLKKGRLNLSISLPLVRHTGRGRATAVQETVMASQHTTSQSLISIVGATFVGPGLVMAIGKLDGLECQLISLLGAIAREALMLLPSLLPTAWKVLQAYVFGHPLLSSCPLEMLVSFWPLFRVIAGAA
jgi:hypothetical protein